MTIYIFNPAIFENVHEIIGVGRTNPVFRCGGSETLTPKSD